MKRISTILLSILISTFGFAQNVEILDEQFSDNKRAWSEKNTETYTTKVSDGMYHIDRKAEKNSSYFKQHIFIDQAEDFSIETKYKQNSGVTNNGFGLVFGYKDIDNFYTFIISGDGHFQLSYYEKDVFTKVQKWKKFSSADKMKKFQVMTFEQQGSTWKFLIDGEMIFETAKKPFYGSKLGFVVHAKQSFSIDYLKVKGESNTINLIENPKNGYKPENLGANINTEHSERTPVITADGQTLFFVSEGDPNNTGGAKKTDIFYSTKGEDGKWAKRKSMPSPLNTTGNNSVIAVSADNNQLMLMNRYREGGKTVGGGNSQTHKTASGWATPTDVEIIDYKNSGKFAGYHMSADRNIMLMSVIRDGDTYGGEDLYVSFKEGEKYSKPLNLGNTINSFSDEFTPFMAADNKTLYFSSYSFNGYGSADIFVSRRLDDSWTKWSKPENLGPEINGDGWDAYLSVEASGKYAYLVSGKNSLGSLDIFAITLPKSARPDPIVLIKGKVLDKKTNKPLSTEIAYYDLETGKLISTAISDPEDGKYSLTLPAGKKYSFLAMKDNYFAISENLDVLKIEEYQEIERDLYLVPIEKDAVIRLNNIFFETNKAVLHRDSHSDLDRLVELLNKHPEMKIEIQGHTDNVGSDASNLTLSKKRAKAVYDYLKNTKNIKESQISSKGYGEKKPVESNKTTAGKAKNRRVEFKIISK